MNNYEYCIIFEAATQKDIRVLRIIPYMKNVYRLLLIVLFLGILGLVIAYARGYRIDLEKRSLSSTGILAVSSNPKAAKIYINGKLEGVTDNQLMLPPGKYKVEIKMDGYMPWSKQYTLKGELVLTADATLFPQNASLAPLTNLGISKLMPIDRTDRLLLFSQTGSGEKDGIYLFDQNKKPFSLFPPLKVVLLKSMLPKDVDFTKSNVVFSPDFKEAIFEFDLPAGPVSYLLSLEEDNKQLFDITTSRASLMSAWDEERKLEAAKILEIFPVKLQKAASESARVIAVSPDKTKVLYEGVAAGEFDPVIVPSLISANQEPETRIIQEKGIYIYDKKEDRNYRVAFEIPKTASDEVLPDVARYVMWYPDSRHVVLNEEKQVSVMEYDNTNKQVVYSGPHEEEFVDVSSDGKLLILANFNPQTNKHPDVYAVGIR